MSPTRLDIAGAASGTEGGDQPAHRENNEDDEHQEADLIVLHGDAAALVDQRELDDSADAPVEMPGEAPLIFNQSFQIREDTRTVFTAEFTRGARSQSGGSIPQPVTQGIDVEYEGIE